MKNDEGAKEWDEHATAVRYYLVRQKLVLKTIASGGCFTLDGDVAFTQFWWRERAKRFAGEPHYTPVGWMAEVREPSADADGAPQRTYHFCAYRAAPYAAAVSPKTGGEPDKVDKDAPSVGIDVEPFVSHERTFVTADEMPPPNLKPTISFSTGESTETAGIGASPFKFKKAYEHADKRAKGYCTTEVAHARNLANHEVCPSGSQQNLAYRIAINFFPRVDVDLEFRVGSTFNQGASVLADGGAWIARKNGNLDWKGDWTSVKVLETSKQPFPKEKWHKVEIFGLSACCDGKMDVQMRYGDGKWTDVSVESLKEMQLAGWKPDRPDGSHGGLDGGDGQHTYSVFEIGDVNFGRQQNGWSLDQTKERAVFRRFVKFGSLFNWTPTVHVFLRRLDGSKLSHMGVSVKATRVTSQGFDLEISKEMDSDIYQVGVTFLAFDADPMYGTKFGSVCRSANVVDVNGANALEQNVGDEPSLVVPEESWTLHEASGFRRYEMAALFPKRLPRTPEHTFYGITSLDVAPEDATVVGTRLFNIDRHGVDFEFSAAGKSHVNGLGSCAVTFNPAQRMIENGELELSAFRTANWNLHRGDGLREFTTYVNFDKQFDDRPSVGLAISHLNSGAHANVRFDATVARVHPGGFELRVATWGDTRLFAMSIQYIATLDGRVMGLAPDSPMRSVAEVPVSDEQKAKEMDKTAKETDEEADVAEEEKEEEAEIRRTERAGVDV